MKLIIENIDGYKMTVDTNEIWNGFGAEQAALKAVEKNHPNAGFFKEQLARGKASKRSSKWKDGIRAALIGMPKTGESHANFVARARSEIESILK